MTPDNIDTEALRELDPCCEGCSCHRCGDPKKAKVRQAWDALLATVEAQRKEIAGLHVSAEKYCARLKMVRGDYAAVLSRLGVDRKSDRSVVLAAVDAAKFPYLCAHPDHPPIRHRQKQGAEEFSCPVCAVANAKGGVEAERDALKDQLDRLAKDLYAENVAASELRVERDALKAEVERLRRNLVAAHGLLTTYSCKCGDCAALRGEEAPRE